MLKLGLMMLIVGVGLFFGDDALARISQPSFVTGDGERAVEQAAGRAYNVIAGIIASIAAITFLIGIGMFMTGNQDGGKKWMINSAIGLVLVGSVSIIYFIAS